MSQTEVGDNPSVAGDLAELARSLAVGARMMALVTDQR
jgi:hypothetical protein